MFKVYENHIIWLTNGKSGAMLSELHITMPFKIEICHNVLHTICTISDLKGEHVLRMRCPLIRQCSELTKTKLASFQSQSSRSTYTRLGFVWIIYNWSTKLTYFSVHSDRLYRRQAEPGDGRTLACQCATSGRSWDRMQVRTLTPCT